MIKSCANRNATSRCATLAAPPPRVFWSMNVITDLNIRLQVRRLIYTFTMMIHLTHGQLIICSGMALHGIATMSSHASIKAYHRMTWSAQVQGDGPSHGYCDSEPNPHHAHCILDDCTDAVFHEPWKCTAKFHEHIEVVSSSCATPNDESCHTGYGGGGMGGGGGMCQRFVAECLDQLKALVSLFIPECTIGPLTHPTSRTLVARRQDRIVV